MKWQKTNSTKKEILIEADERLSGVLVSTLQHSMKSLVKEGKLRGVKVVELAALDGVTVCQGGVILE